MRDLDAAWVEKNPPKSQDDRSFRWNGITVVRLPEMPISAFDEIENTPPPEESTDPGTPQARQPRRSEMRAVVAAVRTCLDPVCLADFDRLADAPGMLTVERLMDLWEALVAETMGRPTRQPSDSSSGQSQNGTPSTGGRSTTEGWTSGDLVPGASPTSPMPTS